MAVAFISTPTFGSTPTFISTPAFIFMPAFGYSGDNTNALAFAPDGVPRNRVASIWGLASMGAGFGGRVFSWLSGRMINRHGYTPVFIGYGIIPLISLAVVLFALGPGKPLREFQTPPPPVNV